MILHCNWKDTGYFINAHKWQELPAGGGISPVNHIYNIYKVWGEIKWDF